MAPRDMLGYVQQKNTEPDGRNTTLGPVNHDLNDLKFSVPTSNAKSSKKKIKQGGTNRHGNNQSGRQPHFNDDASSRSNNSSADAVSTTASTSRQRNVGDQQYQTQQQQQDLNGFDRDNASAAFGGTDFTEDLTEGFGEEFRQEHLPVDKGRLDRNFSNLLHNARADKAGPTFALTHIKGDSYPPTSTGAPSLTNKREEDEAFMSTKHQFVTSLAVEPATVHERSNKPQMQQTSARPQQEVQRNPDVQLPAASRQQRKMALFDSQAADTEHDATAGFAYQPGPAKKVIAMRSVHGQRPNIGQQLVTAGDRTPAFYPYKGSGAHAPQQTARIKTVQDMPKEHFSHQVYTHPAGEAHEQSRAHGRPVEQIKMPEQAPSSEAYTEEGADEQIESQASHETILDYDQSELFTKDLQSLQAEPFDQGASAHPFSLADLPDSATLPEKMARIASTEQKMQVQFFASLNVDEWEDAGEWFIDRFSETIKSLKEVRRAKRKAALAFEDEIEQREVAADKKHALTTAALGEMKMNGMAILQGTPRKGQ